MHTDQPPTTPPPGAKDIVRHIEQLPAPPAVAAKILSLTADEGVDFEAVANLIETDAALSLKVLKMANSLAYGYRGKIESIAQATRTLGFETLRNSLLSVIIRDSLFKDPDGGDPLLTHLWKHSLACAVAAGLLAEVAEPSLQNAAFAAGLVHDCGQMVLLAAKPEKYEAVVDRCRRGDGSMLDLEAEALGLEHTRVGKWLLTEWGMPATLVDAAWLHHQPPEALAGMGADGRLASLICLADILAHEVMCDSPASGGAGLDLLAESFGLSPEKLEGVKARIGEGYAARAAAFDLEDDAAGFYFEALQRANARLATINTDLDGQRTRLRGANRVLGAVTGAGPLMGQARTHEDVFHVLADVFATKLRAPRGFVYHVDAGRAVLEGLAWKPGSLTPFSCSLDDNLAPVFTGDADAPPEHLLPLLSGYLTRIPNEVPDESSRMLAMPPYLSLPLLSGDGFLGELAFAPEGRGALRLPAEERAGFIQLAEFAATALKRLELHGRLEERAERLASALRKIRRMDHKLLQAERLAAVGQLAAGAAHEINNPLAIIYARAQLLELRAASDKDRSDFQQMMAQIERITSILSNLMDFARPAPPRMDPVALNGVAERTIALASSGLEEQGVKLVADLDPFLPQITGDGNQLEQVVLNLIINAEHAVADRSNQGEPGRITVATELRGENAALMVTDNGVGISAEDLDKIFDPFFTTKEEGRGTGLGLSTAYGIVQSHGGDIRFRSIPGSGTEVTVLLPVSGPAPEPGQAQDKQTAPRDTILVVDDEKHIRDILRESLEAQGYAVETASDGEKGLALLEKNSYRLLLLDIRMPSMGGLSLLARAKERIGSMPVIVLTGMAGPEEIDKALSLGVYKCVRKPFQIDSLLTDIADAVKGGEGS